MADLITAQELATWTQNDVGDVTVDPYAIEVMSKVSDLARFLADQPTWTILTAPFDVRLVVLMVCKRAYSNPDQEVATGVGPISSRVLDVAALLLDLTDSERATLTKYNPLGDPDSKTAVLWVQHTVPSVEPLLDAVLFVPDDSLSDWYIPMFSPDDPGDPNNYPDGV